MSSDSGLQFLPFYERTRKGTALNFPQKLLFCLLLGMVYMWMILLYLNNQTLFYTHKLWLLSAIISIGLLSLYLATAAFNRLLPVFYVIDINGTYFPGSIDSGLADSKFIGSALIFGLINASLGYLFGIPLDYLSDQDAVVMLYFGFFLAGFICGLAVWGICGVVWIFYTMAPSFQQFLDYHDPDGCGGTHELGKTLAVFGVVTLIVGVLISIYMNSMPWRHAEDNAWVQLALWFWIVFPYLMAAIVVGIPAVSISNQLVLYKFKQRSLLNSRISALKEQIETAGNSGEVSSTLKEQLKDLREELKVLHSMSVSPLNRDTRINLVTALVPNLFGSTMAASSVTRLIETVAF